MASISPAQPPLLEEWTAEATVSGIWRDLIGPPLHSREPQDNAGRAARQSTKADEETSPFLQAH